MKTKTVKCECDMGCASRLILKKHKRDYKAIFETNNNPVEIGLYQLYRIKSWLGQAVNEIEELTRQDKIKNKKL